MEEASQLPLNINQELGMKKLTKKEYNKLIKAKVLSTGLYNGCHVEQAEVDDELYEHLQEIKTDYKKGVLTAFNADAELAFNYLRYEDEYTDDLDIDFGIDDLYGSYSENMKDINDHFRNY